MGYSQGFPEFEIGMTREEKNDWQIVGDHNTDDKNNRDPQQAGKARSKNNFKQHAGVKSFERFQAKVKHILLMEIHVQRADKALSVNNFKQHTRMNSFETFRAKVALRQSEIPPCTSVKTWHVPPSSLVATLTSPNTTLSNN